MPDYRLYGNKVSAAVTTKTMTKEELKIVFLGTPEFAVASLDRIIQEGWNVAAVVTMPDKRAGRGHKLYQSDVKRYAVEHNLPVLQPDNLKSPAFQQELRSIGADIFVVIAFRMLPKEVWGMPRLGTFNLHASLLPRYRGAAPINRAVMNGEHETGVTTFFLKHEIDTGDIICQRSTAIGPDECVGDVHDRLMAIGADTVSETLQSIVDGSLTTYPQPEGEHIPAPKIFRPDCEIDWNRTSRGIHNHVRGLSPYPAARTTINEASGRSSEAKILATGLISGKEAGLKPGEIRIEGKRMFAGTGDGMIEILSLQPAGKKRMDTAAYLLGHHPVSMCATPLPEC